MWRNADALVRGASARNGVQVQVLSWGPSFAVEAGGFDTRSRSEFRFGRDGWFASAIGDVVKIISGPNPGGGDIRGYRLTVRRCVRNAVIGVRFPVAPPILFLSSVKVARAAVNRFVLVRVQAEEPIYSA